MSAGPIEAPFSCPLKQCTAMEAKGGLILECGTSYTHVSPRLLAEQLCPAAVEAAITAEQRHPAEGNGLEAEHHFRLGSLSLDLSLVKGLETQLAQWFRDRGFDHLNEAAGAREESGAKTMAKFLCAYRSVFTAEHRRGDLPGEVIDEVNENLVQVTLSNKRLYNPEADPASDELFRSGVLLLYGVQDCLAFPATARETMTLRDTADSGTFQAVNHPLYTIEHRKKMPHRNKARGANIEPRRVVGFDFGGEARNAIRKADRSSKLTDHEAGVQTLDWLCEKVRGSRLDWDQEKILRAMMTELTWTRRRWLSHHKLGRLRKKH